MRSRNIKTGFWESERVGNLTDTQKILYIGLWCIADREGKLEDRPGKIRHLLFGYSNDPPDINGELTVLERSGFIHRYKSGHNSFLIVRTFKEHQSPHHTEKESEIPDPERVPAFNRELTVNPPLRDGQYPPDSLIPDSLIPDSLNPKDKESLNFSNSTRSVDNPVDKKTNERVVQLVSETNRRRKYLPDPKKPKKPLPFWNETIEHMKKTWEKRKPGAVFMFGPKEAGILAPKVRAYMAWGIKALWDIYLRTEDDWYRRHGYDVPTFCGAIGVLVDSYSWKQAAETYKNAFINNAQQPVVNAAIGKLTAHMENMINGIRKEEAEREGIA